MKEREVRKVRLGTVLALEADNQELPEGAWELSYTDSNADTVTLMETQDTLAIMSTMRQNALVILPEYAETPEQAITWVRGLFSEWWNRRKNTYGWLDENLNRTDYDPLENYDRKEEGGWTDTDDMASQTNDFTPRTSDTVTETPGVTVRTTQTPHVQMTTDKNIYGDNSSTAVPVEQVITSPDGTNSDVTEVGPVAGGTNSTVTTHVGKDTTVLGAHKDEHTRLYDDYRVHGNIGVSTVADMLGKEVQLRRPIDLVKFALNEWLDLYTVYIN